MKARKAKNVTRRLMARHRRIYTLRERDKGSQRYAYMFTLYGTCFPTPEQMRVAAMRILKARYPQFELPKANFQNFPMTRAVRR